MHFIIYCRTIEFLITRTQVAAASEDVFKEATT
jgi:hypothetical protein